MINLDTQFSLKTAPQRTPPSPPKSAPFSPLGKVARIDIVEKKVIRYTYSVVRTDNNSRFVYLPLPPEGHARAGFVHTHPTGAGRGVTIFSPADKNFAQNYMRPIYVYGPNGHIIKYDPVMDEVIPIGEDFPKSPYLDSFLEG